MSSVIPEWQLARMGPWMRGQMNRCAGCDHIAFAHVRSPSGPYCWATGGCGCTAFVSRFGVAEPDT